MITLRGENRGIPGINSSISRWKSYFSIFYGVELPRLLPPSLLTPRLFEREDRNDEHAACVGSPEDAETFHSDIYCLLRTYYRVTAVQHCNDSCISRDAFFNRHGATRAVYRETFGA